MIPVVLRLISFLRKKIYTFLKINLICIEPFLRLRADGKAHFVPCCNSYLNSEYFKLPIATNKWNAPDAQALRKSILQGDYKFCKTNICGVQRYTKFELIVIRFFMRDRFTSKANLNSILKNQVVLPDGPTCITVMTDKRCNLSCPSCRSQPIYNSNPKIEMRNLLVEKDIKKYSKQVRRLHLAGQGEFLFSPWSKEFLKKIQEGFFPNLESCSLLTNGLLLDKNFKNNFSSAFKYIKKINISIDAGNAKTYALVRNGDWNRLMENLEWLSYLRKNKELISLKINCVVQNKNYESILDLVRLGYGYKVDQILFKNIEVWSDMKFVSFEDEAVHRPSHPNHNEYLKIARKAVKYSRVYYPSFSYL